MKYPCKNCVCIPICKNKKWFEVLKDCSLLSSYFYDKFGDLDISELKSNKVVIREIHKTYFVNGIAEGEVSIGRYDER